MPPQQGWGVEVLAAGPPEPAEGRLARALPPWPVLLLVLALGAALGLLGADRWRDHRAQDPGAVRLRVEEALPPQPDTQTFAAVVRVRNDGVHPLDLLALRLPSGTAPASASGLPRPVQAGGAVLVPVVVYADCTRGEGPPLPRELELRVRTADAVERTRAVPAEGLRRSWAQAWVRHCESQVPVDDAVDAALRVAQGGVTGTGDGTVTLRLVLTAGGRAPVEVTGLGTVAGWPRLAGTRPRLPLRLAPGQSRVLEVTWDVSGCARGETGAATAGLVVALGPRGEPRLVQVEPAASYVGELAAAYAQVCD